MLSQKDEAGKQDHIFKYLVDETFQDWNESERKMISEKIVKYSEFNPEAANRIFSLLNNRRKKQLMGNSRDVSDEEFISTLKKELS